ncbi:MAG TPA: CNNM domain-containing protein [Planctomycetota bacterium]|jgi:CBS domain containing-hemolysin-like protein|nr:CNNM domain-containing protein [Planctomycetota bacterium]
MAFADLIMPVVGVLLLGVNFFFVLAEFAMVRVRASRIAEIKETGDRRADRVQVIQGRLDEYLSVAQVGITGATLGIGIIIEDGISRPIVALLGGTSPFMNGLAHTIGFLLATFLVIVSSELLPKAIAIRYAEPMALRCARPLQWCYTVFYPLLWLLTRSAQGIMRLLGLKQTTDESAHSEDELRIILEQSQSRGLMSFRRLLFLENVFDLGDLKVKDAMRPRSQVRFITTGLHWNDTDQFIRTWRFSRYPLIHDDPEKPIGLIHIKDLFFEHHKEEGAPDLLKLARPYLTTTDATPLEALLAEMQRRYIHVALVLNADGKWVGMITMEDIIEEIIGTVRDEFETEEPLSLAETIAPGRVVLDLEAANMNDAIRIALNRVQATDLPQPKETIIPAVLERERLASTYLGRGLAMPHARLLGIQKPAVVFVRSRIGIPVGQGTKRARFLFILLTPAGQPRTHQRLQARIAQLMDSSDYVGERINEAATAHDLLEAIRTGEMASLG